MRSMDLKDEKLAILRRGQVYRLEKCAREVTAQAKFVKVNGRGTKSTKSWKPASVRVERRLVLMRATNQVFTHLFLRHFVFIIGQTWVLDQAS